MDTGQLLSTIKCVMLKINSNLYESHSSFSFYFLNVDAEVFSHQYHHYRCTVAGKVINAAIMDTLA